MITIYFHTKNKIRFEIGSAFNTGWGLYFAFSSVIQEHVGVANTAHHYQ